MTARTDRRHVLKLLAAAGIIAHAPEASARRRGGRVLILGAGLAGLAAAYKLKNAGYEVIVLEGQERVGGRVLTAREGFIAGGHAELGATRIFSTHEATLRYVE